MTSAPSVEIDILYLRSRELPHPKFTLQFTEIWFPQSLHEIILSKVTETSLPCWLKSQTLFRSYLDFSAALSSVEHSKIYWSCILCLLGHAPCSLSTFWSFFLGSSVGLSSSTYPLNGDVPQGSTLGPLPFFLCLRTLLGYPLHTHDLLITISSYWLLNLSPQLPSITSNCLQNIHLEDPQASHTQHDP